MSGLVGQTMEYALKPVVVEQNPKLEVKSSLKKILDHVLAQVNAMESVAIQIIALLVGLVRDFLIDGRRSLIWDVRLGV